ncbi:hypothetical protein ABH20_02570, partial [Geobacillus sp. T6]
PLAGLSARFADRQAASAFRIVQLRSAAARGQITFPLGGASTPRGEEHLPVAIARMAIFRRCPQNAGCF